VAARLFTIPLSHPGICAHLALEQAGVEHQVVELLPGVHPLQVRGLGFAGTTVPALRLDDGTRVQGSREICAWAHEHAPGAGLLPDDPQRRARVLEAERWGEEVLQPIPRRLIRRALSDDLALRRWFARVATPLPLPWAVGLLLTPVAPVFARISGASRQRADQDVRELPALLDRVDALLADGTLGGEALTVADLQIGASLRALLAVEDVGRLVAGRPADALARRVLPDFPAIPAFGLGG
jgi:glutathione S-transferase